MTLGLVSTNHSLALKVIAVVLVSPLCLLKQATSLRYASVVSLCCIVFAILIVAAQTPAYLSRVTDFQAHFTLVTLDWRVFDSMTIIIFACAVDAVIPVIYSELSRPSLPRMFKVIDRSLLVCFLISAVLGVCGYFSYIDSMPQLVTDRNPLVPGTVDWPMLLVKTVMTFSMLVGFSILFNSFRLAVSQVVRGHDYIMTGAW
jgi:amino acid permease